MKFLLLCLTLSACQPACFTKTGTQLCPVIDSERV
jgi:hypothetical protein